MNPTLLIEIGCEDLPARYVMPLADALRDGVVSGLVQRGLRGGEARRYATPRRIAVLIPDLPAQQPEQKIERSGPALKAALKDGQPTPAALGFAKTCGVEFSALGEKDGKLHFSASAPGQPTPALIAAIFEDTLKQMDSLVPKRMRWGSGDETFVRPVQWLCALFGSDVIPLSRFGCTAGRITYGHRFHAPEAITLKSPNEYAARLREAHVWADSAERKAAIRTQILAQAAKVGGHARITEELLDEVTALVEKPVAITGHFEERFLTLPPEVIVATVETNQRYFTVFKDAALTHLTNAFITVSNIESRDVAQVISGNERVVRPRLTDALFFYEQDLKRPLADYGETLKTVTFQKDLGSTADKVARVTALAESIAQTLKHPTADVRRAAQLCKNDLVTKMVYEFPELQGLMGGYYATKSGESTAVAQAIREHYLPTQQGTEIPSTREGQIVSLTDKLDTLAGIFAIGQKPTASKDPYALRRAALGALRICHEARLPLDIAQLLDSALNMQPVKSVRAETRAELIEFVLERIDGLLAKVLWAIEIKVGNSDSSETDFPVAEIYRAVRTVGVTVPMDFFSRAEALYLFWKTPEAKNLAAAHKRVRNILKQAGEGAGRSAVEAKHFEHEAERALHAALGALKGDSYAQKLSALAGLRGPVDAFFEAVMVNAENPAVRENRLALLRALDIACREVADISLLPG